MKFLLLFAALSLQAQNGVFYIPPTIYPGSRLAIFYVTFELGSLQTPTPPQPTVTVTIHGRDHLLPWIGQPFPPADELNPNPNAGSVYIVPRDLPLGRATLRYRDLVVEREVGGPAPNEIYTLNGTSIAYAQQQTGNGALRRNRLTDPARPGDRITLWGTGLDRSITAYVGAQQVDAVVSHQTDGLDRIEFTLPENTPADCSQLVWVNGKPATIATAEPGSATCPHRLGIVPSDLMRLDRGQTVPISTFRFSRDGILVQHGDFALSALPDSFSPFPFVSGGFQQSSGGCHVETVSESFGTSGGRYSQSPSIPVLAPPQQQAYDAELIAPDGASYHSRAYGLFRFSSPTNEDIWKPGRWTFRLLSPQTATVTVTARAQFGWKTEPDFEKFSHDRDFVLEWDPSLGDSRDGVAFVHNQISERAVNGILGHQLVCGTPMIAGQLIVPSRLMRAIQWVPTTIPVYTGAAPYFQPSIFRAPDGRYVQVSY